MNRGRKLLPAASIMSQAPSFGAVTFAKRGCNDQSKKKADLPPEIESLEKLGTRVNAQNFSMIPQETPKGEGPLPS